MQIQEAQYSCAWCGEINHTFVDPSQGDQQSYVEDCQVCCHPNILSIFEREDYFEIRAEQE
ncbi:MAG: CPXCG motif-containing cysteine-rich protein [Balneolales bacterium]